MPDPNHESTDDESTDDESTDIFNCGWVAALSAIAGFFAIGAVGYFVFGISMERGADMRFVLLWWLYWLPVLWLMRNCITKSGSDSDT